ncbi:MAG: lipocalin-like domain protein [Phenylobacterium sp.]|nr:lipocalin-like domain protein [Phenylobacterium sp.]
MSIEQTTQARPVAAKDLVGVWELVAWTRADPGGQTSYPFSADARGRIIYDAGGLMSAFLMNPAYVSDPGGPGHRFLSYSGRYALNGDVVEHAVDLASDPKFVGLTLRRRVVPDGQRIILETLAAVGREEREGKHQLVWRRAG